VAITYTRIAGIFGGGGGGGGGSVTSVSVVSANGFAGTVANPTTTPAITLTTTISGLLKGNGTSISAATAGTDYVIPSGSITGTAGNITATSNSTLTTLSSLSLPYSQLTGTPSLNFANQTLSNLSGTTAVNQNLVSGVGNTYNVGSSSNAWSAMYSNTFNTSDGLNTYAQLSLNGISPSGVNTKANLSFPINSGPVGIWTSNNPSTENLLIETGSASSGNSGDLKFTIGTATGTRGKIRFIDGSQGTAGYVWTSTDTNGAGAWQAASGGISSISIASSNGFAGSSSGGSTPTLTLSTSITGILKGNGTAISAASAGTDYVIPSGSITGTASNITATSNSTLTTLSALSLPGSQVSGNISGNAANITATSNSTLTTLSALSLPGSQVTGNISGNAANITATSNSTLTTLSALSLPGSQVSGNISGNAANVTGTVGVANGGTGDTSFTANQIVIGGTTTTGALQQIPGGTAGYVATSNGPTAAPTFQPAPGTVSAFFASSQVTTQSSNITSSSFTTFSNSPAFTFTPTITGTYKVYCPAPLGFGATTGTNAQVRIVNTSGGATLLYESQALVQYSSAASAAGEDCAFCQSVYTLTAGTTYVFDIQGKTNGTTFVDGASSPFYMFAEMITASLSSTTLGANIAAYVTYGIYS